MGSLRDRGWGHATCLISRRLPEFWADAWFLLGDLKTLYVHLARFARYASNIPGTQNEAVLVLDDIPTPMPTALTDLKREKS